MMDGQTEQKVRERAYHIWLADNRGHGFALEHWAKAEGDVVAEIRQPAAGASATKPAAVKAVATKAKTTAKADGAKTKTVAVKSSKRAKAPMAEVRGTLN